MYCTQPMRFLRQHILKSMAMLSRFFVNVNVHVLVHVHGLAFRRNLKSRYAENSS